MASITKKNKMYFRTSEGVVRRLDKTSPQLYSLILSAFISGDATEKYKELNKDVKHWNEFKPVQMEVPEDHKMSFGILRHAVGGNPKSKSIVISWNGSWRPLAELKMTETLDQYMKQKTEANGG